MNLKSNIKSHLTNFFRRTNQAHPSTSKVKEYNHWITQRREKKLPALTFTPDLKHAREIASILAAGGLVVIPWGAESRRIYCLIGCFDIPGVTTLMNEVKGRVKNQTLAVGCLPNHVPLIAEVEQSQPLKKALNSLNGKDYNDVLHRCFDRSLGLIIKAKSHIPEHVVKITGVGPTIMIAGEKPLGSENDIYNQTLHELFENYGKVIAGTSANPSQSNVYSIYDQEEAYEDLKFKVDAFIKYEQALERPASELFLTSSTVIDVTGDKPVAIRWGNLHPARFKDIFPDLVIPENILKNPNAEEHI